MSEPVVCRRLLYFGRVQGVGFRLTTSRLARNEPVTGFVRNVSDGSVELVACGSAAAVQKLLDAVDRALSEHIERVEETAEPANFSASTFDIRY